MELDFSDEGNRYDGNKPYLCYAQPGKLFRLMSLQQQKELFENTARSIGPAPMEIQLRHIGNCMKADPAYGKGVADTLKIAMSKLPK